MGTAFSKLRISRAQPVATVPELTRYWDPHLARRSIKLKPGEQYISSTGEMLVTVAGSTCVLCLRDPHEGLLAMLNFAVPTTHLSQLDGSARTEAKRYGLSQLDRLFNNLRNQGANWQSMEVSLVGGKREHPSESSSVQDTLELTRAYLAQHKLPIASEFLGSEYSKKVYLNLEDTSPQIRVLQEVSNTIANREKHYNIALQAQWLLGNRRTSMKFS